MPCDSCSFQTLVLNDTDDLMDQRKHVKEFYNQFTKTVFDV